MRVFREESGKPSFARVFGALVSVCIVAGWWLDGFGALGFELPDLSNELLAIGLAPYGLNKLAGGAWALRRSVNPNEGGSDAVES